MFCKPVSILRIKEGKRNTIKKGEEAAPNVCRCVIYTCITLYYSGPDMLDRAARVRPHPLPLLGTRKRDTGCFSRNDLRLSSALNTNSAAHRSWLESPPSSNSVGTETGLAYCCYILPSISQNSSRSRQLYTMSEERSKISLRSGKRKGRPSIKISGPILQQDAGSRGPPGRPAAADVPPPRPRPPPQSSATVSLHAWSVWC